MGLRSVVLATATSSVLLGCSLSVRVSPQVGEHLAVRPPDCDVRFYRGSEGLDDSCRLLGTLKVRDTGFTISCTSEDVRNAIREHACAMGGDTAALKRVPSPLSTCVQTDAEVYDCTDAAALSREAENRRDSSPSNLP